MKIVAASTGGSSIPAIEAGTYPARCVQIIHIGTVEDEYDGRKKMTNKIRFTFELPTELHTYDEAKGEEPRLISKEYTLSLSEKANLLKDLNAWRGKQFTAEELKGFDVTAVLGAPCQLSIVQKTSKKSGNTYSVIASISKVMKGVTVADQVTPKLVFGYDGKPEEILELFKQLPTFVQDSVVMSAEWKALGVERPASDAPPAAEGTTPKDEVSEALEGAEADTEDTNPPF
jgi:hypothetical protein